MEDIKLVPISAKDIKALDETEYKNLSEKERKVCFLATYSKENRKYELAADAVCC